MRPQDQSKVPNSKIKKVLIANRGEIARRIARACTDLGIESVLVVSDPDRGSFAASEQATCAYIGGSTARESYLDEGKILKAAADFGCDAIHPGYGFLSENAEFAEKVEKANLVFIGPSSQSIRALGSKPNARKTVAGVGVPITPGSEGIKGDKELREAAVKIGFPVIIKAAAGGGGRGMRIVRQLAEFDESLTRARAEALKNFGSEEVYFEKFIEQPRHVEVQLFGDKHGNVVHLGTRDCSAQRRHQKLVEEAPAPFLGEYQRRQIHDAAVRAAKSVGYYNAGTAEFLVQDEEFYFLEINTRIQVEHPITEIITGIDLVQLQLRVAMGESLPFTQEEITFSGHAIEFRINAEATADNFRPVTGTIGAWTHVRGPNIREDEGYRSNDIIPPYYDSLLSKVIVRGDTRAHALSTAHDLFKTYEIKGIDTSIPFHKWILCTEQFQTNGVDIGFVERCFTAAEIQAVEPLFVDDVNHHPSFPGGACFIERVCLPQGERACLIDIVHEQGGTFLAKPLSEDGSYVREEAWRRSNSRLAAVESVVAHLRSVR